MAASCAGFRRKATFWLVFVTKPPAKAVRLARRPRPKQVVMNLFILFVLKIRGKDMENFYLFLGIN